MKLFITPLDTFHTIEPKRKIHTYDRRESSYPETRDKPSSLIDKVRVDNRIHIHIVS